MCGGKQVASVVSGVEPRKTWGVVKTDSFSVSLRFISCLRCIPWWNESVSTAWPWGRSLAGLWFRDTDSGSKED